MFAFVTGRASVDPDVAEEESRSSAKEAAGDALRECRQDNGTDCRQEAKAAYSDALGRNASETQVQRALDEAGTQAVRAVCAGRTRTQCLKAAREELARLSLAGSKGLAKVDTSGVVQDVRKASESEAGATFRSCYAEAESKGQATRRKCKKEAAAAAKGVATKELTGLDSTQLEQALRSRAQRRSASLMAVCVNASAPSSEARAACRKKVRGAMEASTGRSHDKTDAAKAIRAGAAASASNTVGAAKELKMGRAASLAAARESMARALGKQNSSVDTTDVLETLGKEGRRATAQLLVACRRDANVTDKKLCWHKARARLAERQLRNVSEQDVRRQMRQEAVREAGARMRACISDTLNSTQLLRGKNVTVRTAKHAWHLCRRAAAEARRDLGLANATEARQRSELLRAARADAAEAMSACKAAVQQDGEDNTTCACKAWHAFAVGAGLNTTLTRQRMRRLARVLRTASREALREVMRACKDDTTKDFRAQCLQAVARKLEAMRQTPAKDGKKLQARDVLDAVAGAAAQSAGSAMASCAADAMADAKAKGGAAPDRKAIFRKCAASAFNASSDVSGKNSTAAQLYQQLRSAGCDAVRDAFKACRSAEGAAEKKACLLQAKREAKATLAETSGDPATSDTDLEVTTRSAARKELSDAFTECMHVRGCCMQMNACRRMHADECMQTRSPNACMSAADTSNRSEVHRCRKEARAELKDTMGEAVGELETEVSIREGKVSKALQAVAACKADPSACPEGTAAAVAESTSESGSASRRMLRTAKKSGTKSLAGRAGEERTYSRAVEGMAKRQIQSCWNETLGKNGTVESCIGEAKRDAGSLKDPKRFQALAKEAGQRHAADRYKACTKVGVSEAKCRALAKKALASYGKYGCKNDSAPADALLKSRLRAFRYASLCGNASKKQCLLSAEAEAKKLGMKARELRRDSRLAARAAVREVIVDCRDANGTHAECMQEAKAEMLRHTNMSAHAWSRASKRLAAVANATLRGQTLQLVRKRAIEVDVDAANVSLAKAKKLAAAVAKLAGVSTKEVLVSLDRKLRCRMRVNMSKSKAADLDKVAAKIADELDSSKLETGATGARRQLRVKARVYAGQAVEECSHGSWLLTSREGGAEGVLCDIVKGDMVMSVL